MNLLVVATLATSAAVQPPAPEQDADLLIGSTQGVCDVVRGRNVCFMPPSDRLLSKKERWLLEKQSRPDVHFGEGDFERERELVAKAERREKRRQREEAKSGRDDGHRHHHHSSRRAKELAAAPGSRIVPVTTLYNVHTHELLPLLPGEDVEVRFHTFLRDHYTNQATRMDVRLVDVLSQAARHFSAQRIEVISGFRSPKYNRMLRKKGHQVARDSQHTQGNAVDFRVRGVKPTVLRDYVKSLHLGGVGYYPNSQFVHSDTGRVRYWVGS